MIRELSEIDQVRCQRDTARTQNARLQEDNERLSELLHYARLAIVGEYEMRSQANRGAKP
jgi:hypothetical protein